MILLHCNCVFDPVCQENKLTKYNKIDVIILNYLILT
jgi:hypothetical protein